MFFVVQHDDYRGFNPFLILKAKLFPVSRSKLCTPDGYKTIIVRTYRGRCNIAKVNRILSPVHRRALIPETLKKAGINGFKSDGYLRGVLFNTAAYLLAKTGADARLLKAAVIDRNGDYVIRARQLLETVGTVVIYTNKPEKYRALSEDNLTLFGADFVIAPQENAQIKEDFIISPTENPPCIYADNNRFELDNSSFTAAAGFSRILPDGISQADYAAALAIFEGQSRMMKIKSQTLKSGGEICMVAM